MDKKVIAICIAVVIVVAAVVTAIAVTQNDKYDYSGTIYGNWEVKKEFEASYNEYGNPVVTEMKIPEYLRNVTIKRVTDYSAKVHSEIIDDILSVYSNAFSSHGYNDDGTAYDSYGYLNEDDVLSIYTLESKGGKILVRCDLYGRQGIKVTSNNYDFGIEKGTVLQASDVCHAIDMEKIDDDTDGCTITIDSIEKGFMFYTVTDPLFTHKFISVPSGYGFQVSIASTGYDAILDYYCLINGSVTITSNVLKDGYSDICVMKYTADGTGVIDYPEISDLQFFGTQRTVQPGKENETVKDFTLKVEKQIGPIIKFRGTYQGGSSEWYATVTPTETGDYKLDLLSEFNEDETHYLGAYVGVLAKDLSSFKIYCHAAGTNIHSTLTGYIDLTLKK